jgi:hypothetical protein
MERSAESPIGNMPIEALTGPVIPELSDQPCSNFGMADHGRAARVRSKEPAPRGVDNYPAAHNETSAFNLNDHDFPTEIIDLQLIDGSDDKEHDKLHTDLATSDEFSADGFERSDPVQSFGAEGAKVLQFMLGLGSDDDSDDDNAAISEALDDTGWLGSLKSPECPKWDEVLSCVQQRLHSHPFPPGASPGQVKQYRPVYREGIGNKVLGCAMDHLVWVCTFPEFVKAPDKSMHAAILLSFYRCMTHPARFLDCAKSVLIGFCGNSQWTIDLQQPRGLD